MIKKIIGEENFKINPNKTRIAGLARAKIVTGLVISNDSVGIGRSKYKSVRSKIHHLTLPSEQSNSKLLSEVIGWLAYLKSVDVKRLNKTKKYIKDLAKKYPNTLIDKL